MDSNINLQLDDSSRAKLDSIVLKMASQNAPKEDVQAVVADFKQKYGKPISAQAVTPESGASALPNFGAGGIAAAAGPNIGAVASNLPGSQLLKDVGRSASAIFQGIKGGIQSIFGNKNEAQASFEKSNIAASRIEPLKDIGSGANLALTAVAPFAGGSTVLGRIGTNAAIGAGMGAAGATSKGKPFADVAADTVIGGLVGGALSGIGEAISLAKNGNIEQSSSIMNRVARLKPTDANKFKEIAGMSHGEYLAKTGNFGTPEQIVEKEAQKFVASLDQVDSALAKLPGTYHSEPVMSALEELAARETRVSAPGAPSPDLNRVMTLLKKSQQDGLTMSEINQVKRLYERNVKLGYNKLINADAVARATNIDNAMRNWQFNQAENLGLKNLPALNKQTQISKKIINSLGRQITGKTGNNAISLTDWIMLSHGNPQAVAGFLTKKTFSSSAVQSAIAKKLAGEPTINAIEASLEPTAESIFRNVSPTGAKLLAAPSAGTPKVSIPSNGVLRVAPKGANIELTSKAGVIPSKPAKLLKSGK